MSINTTVKTTPVNPASTMKELGMFWSRGGNVALDAYFTQSGSTFEEYAKYIIPGTTGDIIIEGVDGNIMYEPNRPAGWIGAVLCKRVLSAYTFPDIGAKTTTATDIVWRGGQ